MAAILAVCTVSVVFMQRWRRHGKREFKHRVHLLHSYHQFFLQHLKNRINLAKQNTALILLHELNLTRKTFIQQEKEELSALNKIHNFTNLTLPNELNNLLNKGTNFIPTTANHSTSSTRQTIFNEINTTLEQVINKKQHPGPQKIKSNGTKQRYKPYTKNNPIKLLQLQQGKPDFNI